VPAYEVLVIDDDPVVGSALRDGARLAGYRVAELASAPETALELARRHRPKLAIIDAKLGDDGSGVELAAKLLALGPIGIIYVTGFPERVRSAPVGHAWMPKPYRVLDLINALRVIEQLREGVPITTPMPPELHLLHAQP
jgi:DNA-binding response OmpR family regulator